MRWPLHIYPDRSAGHMNEEFERVLVESHLIGRLGEPANWSLEWSGGEQQRIGVARVFLCPPD